MRGGATVQGATSQLLKRYDMTTANDDVDNHDVWLGLALAQYSAGTMTRDVHGKALEVTESEEELDRWFGDSRGSRAAALAEFGQQLRSLPDAAILPAATPDREVPWWARILLVVAAAFGLFFVLRMLVPTMPVFATWPFLLAAAYTGRVIRARFIARS